jgi:hypothetical protein
MPERLESDRGGGRRTVIATHGEDDLELSRILAAIIEPKRLHLLRILEHRTERLNDVSRGRPDSMKSENQP